MKQETKNKIKKIAKYTLNTMNILNAFLLVLIPIWGIPYGEQISATLVGFGGVISTYLLGNKYYEYKTEGE